MTLRDVAEKAGVSPKTVSRVVNEDPAVSEDTRAAVLQVIRDLNYVPDHAARMMRTATSDLVGLMTDVIATTPTTFDLVRGAQTALRSAGRTMLIANSEGDRALEREFWRRFRGHKASGVIYATMYHRPLDFGTPDFERPIVLANCFSTKGDRTAVVPDDERGGYLQAAHLLALGHRRIGLITLNPVIRATVLRGPVTARPSSRPACPSTPPWRFRASSARSKGKRWWATRSRSPCSAARTGRPRSSAETTRSPSRSSPPPPPSASPSQRISR